jgi:hypothetical protein
LDRENQKSRPGDSGIQDQARRPGIKPEDADGTDISPDGRVMDMLSEHTLEGYLLPGTFGSGEPPRAHPWRSPVIRLPSIAAYLG